MTYGINNNEVEAVIKITCELRPMRVIETASLNIALKQEEIRLHYYLDKLKDIIEKRLNSGESIDLDSLFAIEQEVK